MEILFKVGDRVKTTYGEEGTVVCKDGVFIGVSFDIKKSIRHTCDGHCEHGYGWYEYPRNLTKQHKSIDEDGNIY